MGMFKLRCPVSLLSLLCWSCGNTAAVEPGDCSYDVPATNSLTGANRPEIIDANGFVIGSVLIEPGSIFDLDDPKEDGLLYRLANKAHIETRANVIEQQLLFAAGDPYSSQRLSESERLLRENRYLNDASVELIRKDDCVVDVKVHTTDTWSLSPKMSFSRSGGTNSSDIGFKETNLLGSGIHLAAVRSSDVDRTSSQIKIIDRNLGDSWYRLELLYEDNSDGYARDIIFGRPFYSLGATEAHGFSYYDNERIESLYDLGKEQDQYLHNTRTYEFHKGWSDGIVDNWVRRITAGLAYDEHEFSAAAFDGFQSATIPENRRLFYPYVNVEWLQNKFDKAMNQDQIGRVEDRFLGTRFNARLGRSRELLGSDRDAWLVNLEAQTSFGESKNKTYTLSGGLATRVEGTSLKNFALEGSFKYYKRQSDKRLFYASVSGFYGNDLDADNQMLLGGDNGLRGYPLRYQAGDKRALLSVEQRFFTKWYPFRLFHVGAAAFVDVGRTWGRSSIDNNNLGWLSDAGVGLRLGADRSGLGNVIHVDLAFPLERREGLDDVQFLVSTKKSF